MNAQLLELWRNFEQHYGGPKGYRFGFRDRDLFYRFSVLDLRTNKARITTLEMGHDINYYKLKWYELMKGQNADKTLQGR